METQFKLSRKQKYIIFTSLFGISATIIPEIFGLVAYPQFFTGLIQLLIACFKSFSWTIQRKTFPSEMETYWALVIGYFVIGGIGWALITHTSLSSEICTRLGAGYLCMAWGIAVYHFKHIMFLKNA